MSQQHHTVVVKCMCEMHVGCRHVFSFNNGVLKVDEEDADDKPLFIPYSSRDGRIADLVAAQHFDNDMPDFSELSRHGDISTPAVDKITASQQFSPAVNDWLMAVMGRAMFNVRELDTWRVVPWVIGISNTGKSTLLDCVVKNFYQLRDVGILE